MNLLYLATNTATGKRYVGKTSKHSVGERWTEHKSAAKRGIKTHLYDSIRKHGPEVFTVEEIARTPHGSFASWLEQFFIKQFDSSNPAFGYNLTLGGEGCRASEQTREKLRAAMRARVAAGIHKIPENRPRGRSAGYRHSAESRQKMSASLRGRKFTGAHRQKLSQAKIGRVSPNKGTPRRKDISDQEIVKQYTEGKSLRAIATGFLTNKETIRWRLRKAAVTLRPRRVSSYEKGELPSLT